MMHTIKYTRMFISSVARIWNIRYTILETAVPSMHMVYPIGSTGYTKWELQLCGIIKYSYSILHNILYCSDNNASCKELSLARFPEEK